MAAYAAATSVNLEFSIYLTNFDVVLPPLLLETFKFAYKELKSFQNFLERLDRRSRKRMSGSLARITEAIHKYEKEEINHNMYLEGTDAENEEFISGTRSFMEDLKKVKEEYYSLPEDDEEEIVPSKSKSKMVGLRDQWRQLKDDVIAPLTDHTIYLLAGMAGIGKTILAREIFDDLDVEEWYDCRAWVTVGIEWKPEEITEVILAQVDPEGHKMVIGGSKEEIGEKLKESLKGRRYLIVLDDVWNEDIHEYLESLLPDNRNGSHVLITSRMKYIGRYASTVFYRMTMRLLDKEESWNLLREKVFAGESCPRRLEKAGKEIAEKCDGLPLTIVIVANFLSQAEESLWIEVATKKRHQLFVNAYDQISQVLYPSYNILDERLKLCFLYMGTFPLKYEIPKSRLINLWIAEEFIALHRGQTLESFAVNELEFLEVSSLIMVYQRDITSIPQFVGMHVKTCGLHSVWWHFCQIEARETNLFHVLDYYNEDTIEEAIKGHSRLSIQNNVLFALKHVYNSIEEICKFTVHSLLCFGPYCQYMVPVCFGLKFLCRLDALNIRFYDFPLEVLKLIKLRYLALTCNGNLPPSISDLRELQYLIVHPHLSITSCGAPSYMPIEIWSLEELKHLEVKRRDLPYLGDIFLQKLITLLGVTMRSCTVLNRVPNLTKLGIKIELTPDAAEPLCCFDHISSLTKLESLKCAIVNPGWKFETFSLAPFPLLPFSLTKLSLSGLGYPWEEMSKIASLPNLEVLKLRYNAF